MPSPRSPVHGARCSACGFSLVELLAAIAIITVLFGLVLGVATRAIEAYRIGLQESAFAMLDGALDDFAQQNPLKSLRNLKGNEGVLEWKYIYGKYPPINLDLEGLPPSLSSTPRTDLDIAGRTLLERIVGEYKSPQIPLADDPHPLIDVGWPNRKVRIMAGDGPAALSDNPFDTSESFLFYVKYFAPSVKERLERLPGGMITNTDADWVDLNRNGIGDPEDIDLFELRDIWGHPVLYINDRRDRVSHETSLPPGDGHIDNPLVEINNGEPVFVSPGPDGRFTANDIPAEGQDPPSANPLSDNIYSIARELVDRIDTGQDTQGPLSKLLRYDFQANRWAPLD